MTGRLAGKRALVIGGTGSIGSDLCRAFTAEGADVIIAARNQERLDALASELRGRGEGRVVTVSADVATAPHELAEAAWGAFGGVDVVVSNAITSSEPEGDILSTPDNLWADHHELIVFGPMRVMRTLAPRMRAAGGGNFIGVISATVFKATPGYDAYALAKGSLLLLSRYMAKEWGGWNIRANCLSLGSIASFGDVEKVTEMAKELGTFERLALPRVGTNDEVIGAAVYLASDESSYVTGQCLRVDGGRI
jgi:NAD(P)-dependent dehydrogenase (short-subunit alcohol dehydrogenase family)